MLLPHVYVINLDGSDKRMADTSAELSRVGLPFTRVSAVDGRQRSAESFPQYDHQRAIRFLDRDLMGGEVACYLSHLACVQRFLATDASLALVLEDDAVLHETFAESLAAIVAALDVHATKGWHVMHLATPKLKLTTPTTSAGAHVIHRAHYFPMRTTALLWSREGARAFADLPDRIFAPVDVFLRYWATRTGQGLVIAPRLAHDRGEASEIGSGDATLARQGGYRGIPYFLRKQRRIGLGKLVAYRQLLSFRFTRAWNRSFRSTLPPAPVP